MVKLMVGDGRTAKTRGVHNQQLRDPAVHKPPHLLLVSSGKKGCGEYEYQYESFIETNQSFLGVIHFQKHPYIYVSSGHGSRTMVHSFWVPMALDISRCTTEAGGWTSGWFPLRDSLRAMRYAPASCEYQSLLDELTTV